LLSHGFNKLVIGKRDWGEVSNEMNEEKKDHKLIVDQQ
jgi:hypothetical protein